MKFGEILVSIMPRSRKTPEGKIMNFISLLFGAFFLFCLVVAFVIFAVTMKPRKVVSVPNLNGLELVAALEQLQAYELVPEVHQRNSRESIPKGQVFAQHPRAGANVRMGGTVVLSVSRGLADIEIGNYVGWMLSDVEDKVAYQNELNGGEDILSVAVSRMYHKAPVNEVISQSPDPGTRIDKPSELVLTVSLGPWTESVSIPDLEKKDFKTAIKLLSASDIPFNFRYQDKGKNYGGQILAQTPSKGQRVPKGSFCDVLVGAIKEENDQVFGVFDKKLPVYKTAVNLSVYIKVPKIKNELYYSMKHPGGNVSIPYYTKKGTVFTVEVEGSEVARFEVE